MGFRTKIFILLEEEVAADQPGLNGETACVVWCDSGLTIDLGHVTRLEKVIAPRYAHINHSSYGRAGICMVDCFFLNLFEQLEQFIGERFAPEIIVDPFLFEREARTVKPTVKVGGRHYLKDVYPQDGVVRLEEALRRHNVFATLEPGKKGAHLKTSEWMLLDPPFLWARCVEMRNWLEEAERAGTLGWKALVQDRTSLAIVRGWMAMLSNLAEVGARGMFYFH